MKTKTLVLGASTNPERYSHLAVNLLRSHGKEVVAVGPRAGRIADVDIQADMPDTPDIDTVTLYLGPANQPAYADAILALKPRRIIFNPGTENPEFETRAAQNGVQALRACTLVLLSTGQY
jgi:predicted CoA-binding protein